jgi:hypothetical protein
MKRIATILLAAVAAAGFAIHAPAAKSEGKKDAMDKKALDVLRDASALFKNCKSFHCEVDIESTATDGDKTRQSRVKATVDFQKPNFLALHARDVANKEAAVDVVCDGKTLRSHQGRLRQYLELAAPADPGELSNQLARIGGAHRGMVVPNVVTRDPYDTLMDGVKGCSYAGKEDVGGIATHHLKFVQPDIDWELWVAAEGKPVVLKAFGRVVSDDRKLVATDTYKNWKFDEAPAKDTFNFPPPEGAKKVDEFGS